MVTRGFIKTEVARLQKSIDEAREKYAYSGSPSTLRTIERHEDMIHCLEYAMAHKQDMDEGYRIFSQSAKALLGHFLEIKESNIPDNEKIEKIEKAIKGMSYFKENKND